MKLSPAQIRYLAAEEARKLISAEVYATFPVPGDEATEAEVESWLDRQAALEATPCRPSARTASRRTGTSRGGRRRGRKEGSRGGGRGARCSRWLTVGLRATRWHLRSAQ